MCVQVTRLLNSDLALSLVALLGPRSPLPQALLPSDLRGSRPVACRVDFESFLGRWVLGVVSIAARENECKELLVVGCAARVIQ